MNGKDAAAKMAILARLAFHASVHLDEVPFEGIEEITPDDIDYAKEFGLVLKLLGVAERRDGGVSVRVFPASSTAAIRWRRSSGPFNAVTLESPAITEMTLSGPGRRRAADGVGGARRRRVGDELARAWSSSRSRSCARPGRGGRVGVLPAPRGGGPPGRAGARSRKILGEHGVSVKSVVQKGIGENARLVMVMHPVAEGRFTDGGRADLDSSTCCARAPRSIRVIEEEFVS